jgi:hypothetical protein
MVNGELKKKRRRFHTKEDPLTPKGGTRGLDCQGAKSAKKEFFYNDELKIKDCHHDAKLHSLSSILKFTNIYNLHKSYTPSGGCGAFAFKI